MKKFTSLFLIFAIIAFTSNIPAYARLSDADKQQLEIKNALENSGFENGTSKWSPGGGTAQFTVTSTAADVGDGKVAGQFTCIAPGDYVESDLISLSNITSGGQFCTSRLYWKGGSPDIKIQILDSSNVVQKELSLSTTIAYSKAELDYQCLSQQKIRVYCDAAAPVVYLDQGFLGSAESTKHIIDGVPVGTTVAFTGTNVPLGWMVADGRSLARSDYPELFATMGTAHGSASGTHFKIPDLRGKFIRGSDDMGSLAGAAGNDPDAGTRSACGTGGNIGNAIGTCQSDQVKQHNHSVDSKNASSASYQIQAGVQSYDVLATTDAGFDAGSKLTGLNAGSSETRPKNVSLYYIVKVVGQGNLIAYYPDETNDATGRAGFVQAYAGSSAPLGWTIADGACFSKTDYAELFGNIGSNHGECDSGGGPTSGFNVPDLRGYFIRGVDGGAGNDPDAASRVGCRAGANTGDAVGSCQTDEIVSHDHGGGDHSHLISNNTNEEVGGGDQVENTIAGAGTDAGVTTDASGSIIAANGGSETRPKNVTLLYIVKLFNDVSIKKSILVDPLTGSKEITFNDIDWDSTSHFYKTLTADEIFTFSNVKEGKPITVAITASGANRQSDFPGTVKWPGGVIPNLIFDGTTSIYTFISIGGVVYGNALTDMQ